MRMEEKEKNHEYLYAFWLEQMVDGDVIQLEGAKSTQNFILLYYFLVFLCILNLTDHDFLFPIFSFSFPT